jgi:hypothetical protein
LGQNVAMIGFSILTAAVTHPVQGGYDIFENTRTGSVQRRM